MPKSVFEMPVDEASEAAADARAEEDVKAGRVVDHEIVREWLRRLANGEDVPPPLP